MSDDRTPRWISIPLIILALGVLGFAIARYVTYEEPKEEVPVEEPNAPKGKGLKGPPPIPLPPVPKG
jgi:hypothetical protein